MNFAWFKLLCFFFCFIPSMPAEAESGAEFLQSVIQHLHRERSQADETKLTVNKVPPPIEDSLPAATSHKISGQYKITAPTPVPNQVSSVKTTALVKPLKVNITLPHLSKAELLALYQAAVTKSASLASMTANNPSLAASLEKLHAMLAKQGKPGSGTIPGYYYYYYPIKSFMEDGKNSQKDEHDHSMKKPMAHMVPTAMMVMDNGEKNVEPLFMAIAGFVGMALMFAVSVLFLPKFGSLRSRGISALKHAPDELMGLTKLVMEALDGKDCTERIACEVGRAVRQMKLDNKPIR